MSLIIRYGIDDEQRLAASRILYESLSTKFGPLFGEIEKASRFMSKYMVPDRIITGTFGNALVGLVGLSFNNSSYLAISGWDLLREYGISAFRRIWRAAILEHSTEEGELYIDTIAVSKQARGKGFGTQLLQRVVDFARDQGFSKITLEVINTNPRAKVLYMRFGFESVKETNVPWPWCKTFGITSSTSMVFQL